MNTWDIASKHMKVTLMHYGGEASVIDIVNFVLRYLSLTIGFFKNCMQTICRLNMDPAGMNFDIAPPTWQIVINVHKELTYGSPNFFLLVSFYICLSSE